MLLHVRDPGGPGRAPQQTRTHAHTHAHNSCHRLSISAATPPPTQRPCARSSSCVRGVHARTSPRSGLAPPRQPRWHLAPPRRGTLARARAGWCGGRRTSTHTRTSSFRSCPTRRSTRLSRSGAVDQRARTARRCAVPSPMLGKPGERLDLAANMIRAVHEYCLSAHLIRAVREYCPIGY